MLTSSWAGTLSQLTSLAAPDGNWQEMCVERLASEGGVEKSHIVRDISSSISSNSWVGAQLVGCKAQNIHRKAKTRRLWPTQVFWTKPVQT